MRRLGVAAALLAVGACSEGGDPVQMALRDASAARQAAAVEEGLTTAPPAPAVPARGDEADAAFVAGMIEHHRAAVRMAEAALARSDDPEVRRMAQAEIDSRTREIAALQAWEPAS